jgi:hypothetical protein
MNIIDFDGNEHNWPPKGCKVLNDDTRKRSSLHLRCRSLLKKIFPTRQILEEVNVKENSTLLSTLTFMEQEVIFYAVKQMINVNVIGQI